jgi:hypothetical protein
MMTCDRFENEHHTAKHAEYAKLRMRTHYAGGFIIFETALTSLFFPPFIIALYSFTEWLRQFDGILVMPIALLLLALGSILTIIGVFFSSFERKNLMRTILGLSSASILSQSLLAIGFGYQIVGAPSWMVRNNIYYGPTSIPVVQLYTPFFYMGIGLGVIFSMVGLHSLWHTFPKPKGRILIAGIFFLGVFYTFLILRMFLQT